MTRCKQCAIVAAAVLAWSGAAWAWMRMPFGDATVVERSEVIVVGHLDKDSIRYVDLGRTGSASWEYHATLVVTEVMKGSLDEKQIPIVINYGLDPLVGGQIVRANKNIGVGEPDPAVPKDRIDIVDTGSGMGLVPILTDAQKDNLWCLRHLGGEYGNEVGKGPWGIKDPQDVAPLKFKGYFKALLSKDADDQIGRLLADPDEAVVVRILRHLSAQHRLQDAEQIATLLSSPNAKIPAPAAEALADVADLAAVPTFRKALGHANPEVRATACVFLCRFGDTESIATIGKVLPHLDPWQRARVIPNLPQMESPEMVDVLLDQLDEHLNSDGRPSDYCYEASAAAATALKTLTGVDFPLDTAEARRLWDKFKTVHNEVLIRKSILTDIDSSSYDILGRLTNQYLGPYRTVERGGEAAERAKVPQRWQSWAKENITRTRAEWIYAGFAGSGIELPRPMDARGIDMLIEVMEFYGPLIHLGEPTSRPEWEIEGGSQTDSHRYYANWLLERYTGHKVGYSAHEKYWPIGGHGDVIAGRWAAWWKENRDKVKILQLPEERPVTAEMLAKAPPLPVRTVPLSLTVRPNGVATGLEGPKTPVVLMEIKNVSAQDVLVEQRPTRVNFWAKSGGGGCDGGGAGGMKKEDYVTLKPGQTLAWQPKWVSVQNGGYELTYYFAGSQFGLHAWRGKLLFDPASGRAETKD